MSYPKPVEDPPPDTPEGDIVYTRIQRAGVVIWVLLGALLLAGVSIFVLNRVRIIWLPVVLAAGIVFLANPLVTALQRRGLHRLLGTIVAYLLFGGAVTLLGFLLAPTITSQFEEFGNRVPEIAEELVSQAQGLASNLGIDLEESAVVAAIQEWLTDPNNREAVISALQQATEVGLQVVEFLAVFLLAPVLAFYALVDLPGVKRHALALVPVRSKDEIVFVFRNIGAALGGFVRGQLVVALYVGVASSFGLWLLDLDFWLVIGITAGVLNLVPFIGPVVGGALAAIVALVTRDFLTAVWAVAIFVVVQQTDNHIISPLVLRVAVKLHPATIVLALIVGGTLAGLVGVLVAVPVTATAKILAGHFWRTRVLGESWDEAREALIVESDPPSAEQLKRRIRRGFDDESDELIDEEVASEVETAAESGSAETSADVDD